MGTPAPCLAPPLGQKPHQIGQEIPTACRCILSSGLAGRGTLEVFTDENQILESLLGF